MCKKSIGEKYFYLFMFGVSKNQFINVDVYSQLHNSDRLCSFCNNKRKHLEIYMYVNIIVCVRRTNKIIKIYKVNDYAPAATTLINAMLSV
jgi:hypothetical protein